MLESVGVPPQQVRVRVVEERVEHPTVGGLHGGDLVHTPAGAGSTIQRWIQSNSEQVDGNGGAGWDSGCEQVK